MGFRRDLGGEVEKFARGAAKRTVPEAVQAVKGAGPAELSRTEDEYAPAINAAASLERAPLAAGTLKLVDYSSGAVYRNGVDFTETPATGQWTNLAIPQNTRLTASYFYRSSSSGVTDHGALSGLADDDHPQYHDDARGDARYLGLTAKAADSNLLDGQDSGAFQTRSEKGQANGYAPLDSGLLIPETHIPAVAITDAFPAASEAEMLALTAQRGDVAIRSDLSKSFILRASPASTLANWSELRTPTDAVLSVDARTGAVDLSDRYLGIGAKAADSNLLDGIDSTGFAPISHVGGRDGHPLASTAQNGMMAGTDKAKLDSIAVPTFTTATLQNSWQHYDTVNFWPAQYGFKESTSEVMIRGCVKLGTLGQACFTLPVGMRPGKTEGFPESAAGGTGQVNVFPDGRVMPLNINGVANGYYYLSNIVFVATG